MSRRVLALGRFRHALVVERESILEILAGLRPHCASSELLASELLPVLDLCRYLERNADKILAPTRVTAKGRPAWLKGLESVVYREPVGRVLILASANYPLYLALAQTLQALVAGNSVWLKPAPGCTALQERLQAIFAQSTGFSAPYRVLDENPAVYIESLPQVQKVVLVGSAQTGRQILPMAAEALVPVVAELSGWDAVFVHPKADLELLSSALVFGLSLNRGRTCVAPRRVFFQGDLTGFEALVLEKLAGRTSFPLTSEQRDIVNEAIHSGAKALWAVPDHGPVLLSNVSEDSPLLRQESFGPIAALRVVESDREALKLAALCPYNLGASIFGPPDWARKLAHRVPAQCVTVNDVIVPTADPRLPFGGAQESGFGRMRGPEGLLEMTRTRTVSLRHGGGMHHLAPPNIGDREILDSYLMYTHASSGRERLFGFIRMLASIGRVRIDRHLSKRRGR